MNVEKFFRTLFDLYGESNNVKITLTVSPKAPK